MRNQLLWVSFGVMLCGAAGCSLNSSGSKLDAAQEDQQEADGSADGSGDLSGPDDTRGKDDRQETTSNDGIPSDQQGDAAEDQTSPDGQPDMGDDLLSDTSLPDVVDTVDSVDALDSVDSVDSGDSEQPDLRVCIPGEQVDCYTGLEGTAGVGICHEGKTTCAEDGMSWGSCEGEVVPGNEDCNLPEDEDCDGLAYKDGGLNCMCEPGSTLDCYTGLPNTLGVGVCVGGVMTCNPEGTAWGGCEEEIVPSTDECGDLLDDDCNGVADDGMVSGAAGCVCLPGSMVPCYTGPEGTLGVGTCIGGQATCLVDGTGYGACDGELLPQADDCGDLTDDDCNGVADDGVVTGAPGCACYPDSVASCYTGAVGTLNQGPCVAGSATCLTTGAGYGLCEGEVVPEAEICSNGVDEDCNGQVDVVADLDQDGFTRCQGDCCETADQCPEPSKVNPGAFEIAGDLLDNDCDGQVDNAISGCDNGLSSNSSTALDYARAIDLCQTTTENPPYYQRRWGVISAQLVLADGTTAVSPTARNRSIRTGFGSTIVPQQGSSLAILSTGTAADPGDTNPSWASFKGFDFSTTSSVPSDWLSAHGNALPSISGCALPAAALAYDPMMLKLRVRVPTNMFGFTVKANFFAADYPEFVCSQYQDQFLILLNSAFSGIPANPSDKNIATLGGVGISSSVAKAIPQLFKFCTSDNMGCFGLAAGFCTCMTNAPLAGTGFDASGDGCGYSGMEGGGTGWFTVAGNVVPGEVMELRLVIWDTGDGTYDSLVLLDSFQWSSVPVVPGINL